MLIRVRDIYTYIYIYIYIYLPGGRAPRMTPQNDIRGMLRKYIKCIFKTFHQI